MTPAEPGSAPERSGQRCPGARGAERGMDKRGTDKRSRHFSDSSGSSSADPLPLLLQLLLSLSRCGTQSLSTPFFPGLSVHLPGRTATPVRPGLGRDCTLTRPGLPPRSRLRPALAVLSVPLLGGGASVAGPRAAWPSLGLACASSGYASRLDRGLSRGGRRTLGARLLPPPALRVPRPGPRQHCNYRPRAAGAPFRQSCLSWDT